MKKRIEKHVWCLCCHVCCSILKDTDCLLKSWWRPWSLRPGNTPDVWKGGSFQLWHGKCHSFSHWELTFSPPSQSFPLAQLEIAGFQNSCNKMFPQLSQQCHTEVWRPGSYDRLVSTTPIVRNKCWLCMFLRTANFTLDLLKLYISLCRNIPILYDSLSTLWAGYV